MSRSTHRVVAGFAVLLLGACGGGSTTSDNPPFDPPVPPVGTGLDARPDNATCLAPARGTAAGAVGVEDAFPGLTSFGQATKVLVEPVADPRWFVLQKGGAVRVFDPANANGTPPVFLDLTSVVSQSANEGGLLGMAFHPDYPDVPEIFLSYTIEGPGDPRLYSIIARFVLDDVATPGAATTDEEILRVNQGFSNHNGGDIAFGADGFLYIGFGDGGGGGGDPDNRAQDTTRLLGSMLRIDVIGTGAGYEFPSGPDLNPFAGQPACGPAANANDCPEIYAWGFRNPWRWSFDPLTGDLWAGDVGQNAWEEIDRIENGGNYGWRCFEGRHPYDTNGCTGSYVEPVSEYPHADGNGSITGGFVYRGSAIPSLIGRYVFADFASGRIWALQSDGMGGDTNEELLDTSTAPSSFGVDQDGELYFTDYGNGRIMQLIPTGGGGDPVADDLAASGCVDPGDLTRPYSGLVPYDINAAFWSDRADKDRYLGLPNGTTMSVDADDDWTLPPGTVIVQNFRLNGRLIETRHLMRHPDGVWAGYTYEWNAAETAATRVRGGKIENIDGQDWVFPDEAECLRCHTAIAGVALGLETAQLNRDFTYPSTGRTHSQLETLDSVMAFDTPIGDPATLPAMPDPTDTTADLGDRARAYLHTNCAQCHRPGGPTPVDLDLRYTTSLDNSNACDVAPTAGDLGIADARLIAPGDASRSVLVARMDRRDADGMPPLASSLIDADGVALMQQWIDGLAGCN